MATVQELANEARGYLMYTGEHNPTMRDNIYVCRDGTPEWVRDVVYAAHGRGDMLPDDYTYATVAEALEAFGEMDDDTDPEDVILEVEPDIYNADLLRWVSSHLSRMSYVDEAMEELEPKTLADALMAGQYDEKREIYRAVYDALAALAGDDDGHDEE